ncbi:MAG: hypothetical protein J4478_04695 [Candidatus Diapherotrites archaeon]|uniref:Uncharacterized protein n=1 Tax=Candidatus Iainarchaeum sp. TaxID=3101447 RepID=A0A7J4L1N3_9ARCH|nr:MAG: hypothetical protein QT12_C0006G0009 [archaeon GW2011_AR21]MBS3058668.1 hypothetical protein [Candidatus Diapherotrites archaeon]HIH21756.1 hypothetical protein [Candidatus Diapherotrites archaeon]HIH33566.1 hypothetical protein [Candidatus Diapherotrites archaeon]
MEEQEITTYFLEHPDQYAFVKDEELVRFLQNLSRQALTEDEINFLYKKRTKEIMQACFDLHFIEKIMVAGVARYFVTQEAKLFLEEREKLKKSFGIFEA